MNILKMSFLTVFMLSCSVASDKKLPKEIREKATETPSSSQDFRPMVDILFVIDDSGSMGFHQEKLAANMKEFASAIVRAKFLNYQIGVIGSSTTLKPAGKLIGTPKFVNRKTPNGIAVIANNLMIGTSGDGTEKFFDPINEALSESLLKGHNKGFLRENATLAIIIVTDTQDQSKDANAESTYEFLKELKKGNSNRLIVGGVYIESLEAAVTCTGESEIGMSTQLKDFFDMTRAFTFSLCDPQYGERLAELGVEIANRSNQVVLSTLPQQKTISVSVGGIPLPEDVLTGWTYLEEKNSILFGPNIDWDPYPEGAIPQIDYIPRDIDFDKIK